MAYSQQWLEDQSSIKTVFIVCTILYDSTGTGTSYSPITLYFSNNGLTTNDGSIAFKPLINSDVTVTESIGSDGSVSMTYGDISLSNLNGDLDLYLSNLNYIWANQSIQIYLGDPTWNLSSSDFTISTSTLKLIFNGVIADIDSKSREEINIKLIDKSQLLNNSLTQDKLGLYGNWANTVQNADTIKPLVFGEVFNMTPLLIDPNNQGGQYMVNDGPVHHIIEVRDNGIPVYQYGSSAYSGAIVSESTGTFILQYPPKGTVTCSVQGVNNSINLTTGALQTGTYTNTLAGLIALIVTQYGKAGFTLSSTADLDLVSLAAFDTANPQAMGTVVTDTTNVLNICQNLAVSLGAQIFFTREGKLQLLKYGVGNTASQDANITVASTSSDPIYEIHMVYDSISINDKLSLVGAIKLGYCKNWTIQSGLQTAIPADHKSLFATDWLTTTSTASSTLVSTYKLDIDPQQIDTMLLVSSDAVTEATRRLTYYSTQRYVYKLSGVPRLLALRLGQQTYLRHSRFNLYNGGTGTLGQIVSLTPNWTQATIDIEVVI